MAPPPTPRPRSVAPTRCGDGSGGADLSAGDGRRRWHRLRATWDRLTTGYWLVPTACAVVAVAAALSLLWLDRYLVRRGTPAWTYAGGPQNASDTLSTIASSMITFTGLVFSITLLALQLTSSQFSPRALRTFLRDPIAQFSLGVFVGTFAYAFAALSAVRVASSSDAGFVPSVTVTGAFALMALSVLMFVRYIHHMAGSIRVVSVIERITAETRAAIERLYPADDRAEPQEPFARRPGRTLGAPTAGVIVDVDLSFLAERAANAETVVRVLHPVGTYVCEGQPLIELSGADDHGTGGDAEAGWLRSVSLERERTMRADDLFGFRQLVDIAERALSPGTNDPTTAVQCLDRLHDLLRRLLGRSLSPVHAARHDGVVRATMPSATFEDHLRLATEEILHWGRESLQVRRRLAAMLDDLMSAADTAEEFEVLAAARRRVPDERAVDA